MAELDWDVAWAHLIIIKQQYQELLGVPGVNVHFALGLIAAAYKRFEDGERSESLHKEMMGLE